ncbi:MAG: methionyl-tRNA formyltransferase [Lachnospiraceae bacterium]|nr:methionyl-tRNA formyltransferase [Lachnospiraceae bacterium]
MRVLFMGTPDFAANTLRAIVEHGHEVVGVVTQPDKPKGRGKEMAFSAVKEEALKLGLSVLQPPKVREEAVVEELRALSPEVIVVVAFGQILPQSLLDIPPYGCVNVHASLLPAYRGAAPIQWAVIDGLKETGVTTQLMNAGLDTGDILLQSVRTLASKETGGSLFDALSEDGAKLLLQTLEGLEAGTITPVPQDESKSSYAKKLTKDLGNLDFTMDAASLDCLIRGLNPWPSAYTYYQGKTLKIWDVDVILENQAEEYGIAAGDTTPGSIAAVTKDTIVVACGSGYLAIRELQLEGKKRMDTRSFLLGTKISTGEKLCRER